MTLRRRSSGPLQARVIDARPGALTLELVQPARMRRGAVELEWVVADGLARLRAHARLVRTTPKPVLEARFRRPAEMVQRRRHVRVAATFPFRAWSLLDPTTLLSGTTVDLSGGGALVRLPMLPAAALVVDLTLSLPDGPLGLRADVMRREEPDLVALSFQETTRENEERLINVVLKSVAAPAGSAGAPGRPRPVAFAPLRAPAPQPGRPG